MFVNVIRSNLLRWMKKNGKPEEGLKTGGLKLPVLRSRSILCGSGSSLSKISALAPASALAQIFFSPYILEKNSTIFKVSYNFPTF
jgi:hypothetical protein